MYNKKQQFNSVAESNFCLFYVAKFVQASYLQEVPSLFRCLCLNLTDASADLSSSKGGLSLHG